MSKLTLFAIIVIAALAAGLLPGLFHGGIFHNDPTIAAAQMATGFAFALSLGYAAAGIVWLVTWGRASRSAMAFAAILILLAWGIVSYAGMMEESAIWTPR